VRALLPGVAEAAGGFAEADSEIDDSLEPLGIDGAEAFAVSEKQLGVAENAGKRVIDFVAEDRADIAAQSGPRRTECKFGGFGPAKPAFDESGRKGNEISGANDEFDIAFRDEGRDIRLAFERCEQDHGGVRAELAKELVEQRLLEEIEIQENYVRGKAASPLPQFREA